MTHELQFDPALKQRLLARTGDPLAEEGAAEEIPVIARLVDPAVPVPGLQVVTRLGHVVTARLPLERVVEVRQHPNIASLKDSVAFGADLAVSVPDIAAAPALLARAGLGGLTGHGVVVGVADWGCDFAHANFRHADGRTRLLCLWDQRGGVRPSSPRPYGYGREMDAAAIDAALAAADPYAALGYDPAHSDPGRRGTHGTHVLDIAAGNGRAAGSAAGVAPAADLIFVHLRGNDTAPEDTLGDSARLLEAVDYIIRRAGDRPVSINLSLGRTGGPKDGTTLVEQALDALLAERPGRAVCMSTGNYYDAALHGSGRLAAGEAATLRWDVTPRDDEFAEMEIWYGAGDAFGVELIDPRGRRLGAAGPGETVIVRNDGGVILASIFNRLRDPNNGENVINLFLWPDAAVGAWGVRLVGQSVADGRFHAWIERSHPVTQSRFHYQDADPQSTVGTICTGRLTIPVGAYDARLADKPVVYFSSAGPSRDGRRVPLVSAPGAGIRAARSSSPDALGYRVMDTTTVKSGSSMAAPHVTGVVALMFQAALPERLLAGQARHILAATARKDPPYTVADELRYGAGRVDAVAALQAVAALRAVAAPAAVAAAAAVATGQAFETAEVGAILEAGAVLMVERAPAPLPAEPALAPPAPANGAPHEPPLATPATNGGAPMPTHLVAPERTRPGSPHPAVAEWSRNGSAHPGDAPTAESATDPVTPVRPPAVLVDGVGRGRRNRVDDVRAVQTALRDLRYLSAADFAAESPAAGATGTAADDALPHTLAAIEQLQREVQGRVHPDGRIDRGGATLAALNRAIARPTAAEFTTVGRALATITETAVSGVALTQPVGDVADAAVAAGQGNLPDEVRAVQTRLVQLGHLTAGHGEAPAAGTAPPRAAQLPRTRAAIVHFQDQEVTWWRNRRVGGATPITGSITRGVVASDDATHRLLRGITSYREQFPDGTDVRFRDFVKGGRTVSTAGVMFSGTASPAALPAAVYNTVGLTADQTAALQFVSRHEGNFDALNTYDVARVSLGFVQFAGGRGLPPFLALLKSRHPATFRAQLAAFGIEVEFNTAGGNIANATVVAVDSGRNVVLRGNDAEAFIRDNKKLSAVLIRAGRDATVQATQVEAATRDYLLPALATTALLQDGPPPVRARLEQILRSQPGLAVLLDRAIHEGVGGGTARLAAAARWVAEAQGLTSVAAVAAQERAILQQVENDLTADSDIAARVQTAIRSLEALRAAGAGVAATLARPEAAAARRELDAAIAGLPRKSVGARRTRTTAELRAERARLNFVAPPATEAALRAELDGVINRLKTVREDGGRLNVGWADSIRARIRNILAHWPAAAPAAPPAGAAGETEAEQPFAEAEDIDPALGRTHYLPIQLSKAIPAKVGVFIPNAFRPTAAVDLIVYFHGHIDPCAGKAEEKAFAKDGIEAYWNTPLFRPLREILAAAGRQAILIAPTLTVKYGRANAAAYGDLDQPGKFDFLVNETLTQLVKSGELPAGARPGNIALGGHSGGGLPMQQILNTKNSLNVNVSQCWGFECLYFGTEDWERWLKANPLRRFYHFRRPGIQQGPACMLDFYDNFVNVERETTHCGLVRETWRQALDKWPVSASGSAGGRMAEAAEAPDPDPAPASPTTGADGFTLTPLKPSIKPIVLVRKGEKKTAVTIEASPAVFLSSILTLAQNEARKDGKTDLADKLDPAAWFKQFTRVDFLGRQLHSKQYVHLEMAQRLKAIEARLVKEFGGDAKSVGDMLLNKSNENIAGSRLASSTATYSMHMFGLAIDVNYLGNPYIESEVDKTALNAVLRSAALLLNRSILTYKEGGAKNAAEKFDSVQQLDALLEEYFSLPDKPAELARLLPAAAVPEWRGLSVAEAKTKIDKGRHNLACLLERGFKRQEHFKRHAILDFDKRFVVIMEAEGLAWGGHYGDMMHFDMRSFGVGQYVEKARIAYNRQVRAEAQRLFDERKFGPHAPPSS